jgi:hypothetical protein
MDVKIAFLNENMTEDVYMTYLEGFVDLTNAGKVCKLQKSIYGLKQASRSWNLAMMKWSKGLASFGVKKSLVFTRMQVGAL